jgi:hypothetical protein
VDWVSSQFRQVGIDSLISSVPLAGSVGDVFFRANLRNMALLRLHLAQR